MLLPWVTAGVEGQCQKMFYTHVVSMSTELTSLTNTSTVRPAKCSTFQGVQHCACDPGYVIQTGGLCQGNHSWPDYIYPIPSMARSLTLKQMFSYLGDHYRINNGAPPMDKVTYCHEQFYTERDQYIIWALQ